MPRFAANLTFLFTELPFMERPAAAKATGFEGVEVLFPYDFAAQELRARLVENDLAFVAMNSPPPNYAGGERGFAALPDAEARFRHDFNRALRYAQVLKPRHIHVMAGRANGAAARACYVENLKWAAEHAFPFSLMIEPVNGIDIPGYFLDSFEAAAEILDAVGAPNLGLQFDTYHAQMLSHDCAATWARHGARAVHVQIAGAPGRHEPVGGDIDHGALFATLDAQGYQGWVSAEYEPRGRTEAGLGWLPK
ncbi:MAG: TIM barrel protein [Rhodobacteraceae bacterium]|nr:TIM barrel protein [Paracoccaceae bacterium]